MKQKRIKCKCGKQRIHQVIAIEYVVALAWLIPLSVVQYLITDFNLLATILLVVSEIVLSYFAFASYAIFQRHSIGCAATLALDRLIKLLVTFPAP